MKLTRSPRAFTLIELLIVVAILAVLAAIAVPNFLEAQVRAKVSRVSADLHGITIALEAYASDWNGYPPHRDETKTVELPYPRLRTLTTPIGYLTRVPEPDPFSRRGDDRQKPATTTGYSWTNFNSYLPTHVLYAYRESHGWLLRSRGPDADFELDPIRNEYFIRASDHWLDFCYDPSNGTVSRGELFRTHRDTEVDSSHTGGS